MMGSHMPMPSMGATSGLESKPFVFALSPEEMEHAYRFVASLNFDPKEAMAGGDIG